MKRKLLYFLFLITLVLPFSTNMNSQTRYMDITPYDKLPDVIISYKPSFSNSYPDWGKMLYEYPVNYYDIKEKFNEYQSSHPEEESALLRYFVIWSKAVEPFVTEDGSIKIPDLEKLNNAQKRSELLKAKPLLKNTYNDPSNWTYTGPKEVYWNSGTNITLADGAVPWHANVYSFDVAPSDNSILYCGTETGYINKTTDGGLTWHLVSGNYAMGYGATAIAIHPTDPNTVYAAVKKQIYKTTDGGDTWTPLLETPVQTNRIKINPDDPDMVVAATANGVMISYDAGDTWSQQLYVTEIAYDIEFYPNNPDTIYAVSAGPSTHYYHIWRSVDGGQNFSVLKSFLDTPNHSGAMLAVTPANPQALFLTLLAWENSDKEEPYPYIYKAVRDPADDSWTWDLLKKGEALSEAGLGGFTVGQGYFDLVFEVSPDDEKVVFWGTCNLWKSFDGGFKYTKTGGYGGRFEIHPDIQDFKMLPGGKAWVATDGGMTYSTNNFATLASLHYRTKGIVGSEFYNLGQGWNEDIVVSGRYHNGNVAITEFYSGAGLQLGGAESPTGWVINGKSRHTAFDDIGGGKIIPKTIDGPVENFIFSKFPNMDQYGGLGGNIIQHPNYYNVIYLNYNNGIWESDDFGMTFDLISTLPNRVIYLDASYKNPDVMYADVKYYGLYRSSDGGKTWVSKPSLTDGTYGDSNWRGRTFFVISPNDENVIYACLRNGAWSTDIGKVFKSTDGGDTWTDFTGSLQVRTKSLAIQPGADGKDIVYLFSTANLQGAYDNYIDEGYVFYRTEDMTDWSDFANGYPLNAYISRTLPFYRDGKLRMAGTAGVWESPLAEPVFKPVVIPMVASPTALCPGDTLQFDDHSILNHSGASWHWTITPQPAYISDPDIRNPKVVPGDTGKYTVTLEVTQNGQTYSKTVEDMVWVRGCPSLDDCSNPAGLPKDTWKLLYVDSEETVAEDGAATNSFDGDPNTIWHTQWYGSTPPHPHEIQIDLADTFNIHKFTYLPRQNGPNGRVAKYEIYLSDDKADWGSPVKTGTFPNTTAPQFVDFDPAVKARYMRFVALSEVNDGSWTTVAELDLTGCYFKDDVTAVRNCKIMNVKAYPVPAVDHITVPLPSNGQFRFSVYSVSGKLMDQGAFDNSGYGWRYDVRNLPAGTYLIVLTDVESNSVFRVKFVK
jgi:photosystem II stability/assembly factor-like uncharacterized protein